MSQTIKRVKTQTIRPNPENPREISKEKFEKLVRSIEEFPEMLEIRPLVVNKDKVVLGGNMRLRAIQKLGIQEVPVIFAETLTEAQEREFVIKDNVGFGNWDTDILANMYEIEELGAWGLDLPDLVGDLSTDVVGNTDADDVPEVAKPRTRHGDLWKLGDHRILCGDCTEPETVARLMGENKATLLHADPPYGMGKEGDGVANDNLYREKLDDFQMKWWKAFRPFLADNASAYIWGNAPDLWRLWYCGGLAESERLTFRSQVIWDKPPSAGPCGSPIGSDNMRSYPHGYEVCFFFMLGEQGFNNNADNYWEGWEPIRAYLDGERKKAGFTMAQCNRICGKQNMTQSAFTRGGFRLILREDYEKLKAEANKDAFKRDYDAIKRDYDAFKRDYDELKEEFYATRTYFDNTHENMTDVWQFPRVTGEERYGHATPKPVAMMERAIKSSTPKGAIVAEPFLGSGSTLMGAEVTQRKCYGTEINPEYCDIIIKRWEDFTGKKARKLNG